VAHRILGHRFFPLLVTLSLFVVAWSIGAAQYTGFGSARVFFNLFTDNAFIAVTAIGMTFVILSGGIDLSVGSVIALTGVAIAVLVEHLQWHPVQAFALVLVGGAAFGGVMGTLIHFYRLQPFIVTLAGMFFARGLATTLSENSIPIDHPFYGRVSEFGFRVAGGFVGSQTLILMVVLLAAIIAAHYTSFGNNVYSIGGDYDSAGLMGVPVGATTIAIYTLSSTMAALAGILFSFYTFSGYALTGIGLELDAVAAVVIGGTLITGGRGYVAGTLIGVLITGVIQTYISFNGQLNSWWTKIVIGILLLFFIGLQRALTSFRGAGRHSGAESAPHT
jgi:ribose/xylose/arabinose/galactoside ABC-type transport system permease subunit